MASVDDIVENIPPPDKLPKGGVDDEAAEGEAPTEYNAEEDAAMQVASALGADPKVVDVKALCEALKTFNDVTRK